MLLATLCYNISIILLTVAARAESKIQDRTSLTVHVVERASGAWSIGLGIVGWIFELAALTRISVTLARVIYAAGFGLMLMLARWRLGERIQRREAAGILAIALGIVGVGATSPSVSKTTPGVFGWIVLTIVIVPTIFLPTMVQRLLNSPAAYLNAIAAGLGLAASNLYTKGVSDLLSVRSLIPIGLLAIAAGMTSLVAFSDQIRALQDGRATAIVPLVAGLEAVVPIIIASLVFGEKWPAATPERFLLGGGIMLTTAGMIILAYSSAHLVRG